jgi:hypothetical protein
VNIGGEDQSGSAGLNSLDAALKLLIPGFIERFVSFGWQRGKKEVCKTGTVLRSERDRLACELLKGGWHGRLRVRDAEV